MSVDCNDEEFLFFVMSDAVHARRIVPYSGKIWRALNLAISAKTPYI